MVKTKTLKECVVGTELDKKEVELFQRSLKKHGQLHEGKGPLTAGATHQVSVGKSGAKKIVRKRFSAF